MIRVVDNLRQEIADRAKLATPIDLRRRLTSMRFNARCYTASARALPDFLIIGTQRGGTSSLYKHLGRHPEVVPSLRKEVDYFSTRFAEGESWYRAHFPLEFRERAGAFRGRQVLSFEATPHYLFDPRAPLRARELVPDAKLIAVLRDPTDRAVSHYHHTVRNGFEDLSLDQALAFEDERLDGEIERMLADPEYRALAWRRFSYGSRGCYARQLEAWLHHYPADQLLVLRSDDLFQRPIETFDRICDFLGIGRWYPTEFRNYSYADASDSHYPEPPSGVRKVIQERVADDNARLVEMFGDQFAW